MKQAIVQYVLVVLLIVGAYFLGVYRTQVEYLTKGTVAGTTTQPQQAQQQPQTPTTADINKVKALFADKSNLIFGDPNSKILFVEFSDPSCPYCHAAGGLDGALNKQMGAQFTLTTDGGTYDAAVPEMRKLVDAGKAAFAWIYVPGHGNGQMGTMAMYCANEQGKFWPVHDLLMSDAGYNELNNVVVNDRSKSGELAKFLAKAIDPTFMKSCLDSGKYSARLNSDTQLGSSFGASATPTFIVNDHFIEGAEDWAQGFKSIVDPLL